MKTIKIGVILATIATGYVTPLPATAGAIERACLASGRSGASRPLCGCIQQVADATLSGSEQRRAAKFFKDPQKAQDTRQSDNRSHETFWKRYKAFGNSAAAYCG
ncbi:hypothetical protein [Celeribacter arenosi]|uniref:Arginine transporter n=1 Tax=Celeribacter arenosi TaxID=792649 RepID=A0ABP7K5S5_9RHOB